MRESSALSRASPAMNIHEYQAKELLQKFGVATPRGKMVSSPAEAEQVAREIAPAEIVVKAQIHANWRSNFSLNRPSSKRPRNSSTDCTAPSLGSIVRSWKLIRW